MITNFERFKRDVRALGGVWESDAVYFSQTQSGYYADYKPSYPERSKEDMIFFWNGADQYTLMGHLGEEEWIARHFYSFYDVEKAFRKAREAGAKV